MRTLRIAAVALVGLTLGVGPLLAEGNVKSGPQVGDEVPGPFHPLNVTGAKAGQKFCLFCQNGANPVAMVFARDCDGETVKLIKRLDKCTAKNKSAHMGSFVVFLSDSEGLSDKLKEVADKENIKHTVLAIDNPAGPQSYKVAKDADLTVVLYTEHQVKANYAFAKGALKEGDIDQIVADVSKILPKDRE